MGCPFFAGTSRDAYGRPRLMTSCCTSWVRSCRAPTPLMTYGVHFVRLTFGGSGEGLAAELIARRATWVWPVPVCS